ncbi:MAG: prepilin-type N-terminal cleavage/methylation domain-containing protein [Planctomycetaceae bacterium]|nr:prepilin-type N-terminal cleavage/methylation domain-containing protein [Planctomycetaceae bacterium]
MNPARDRSRRGYTLLELVLAAGISTLVMAGIGSFIFLVYRIQATTAGDVSAAGLSRNVLRQLEWDLQSIPGQLPEAAVADPSTQDTSSLLQAVGETDFLVASETETADIGIWLRGDTQSLEILAEPPRRSGRQFVGDVDPETFSEVQRMRRRVIRWGLTDSVTLAFALPEEQAATAIIRAEGLIDALSGSIEYSEMLPVPELLALEFAYFDGSTWLESWDSESVGGLPRAIEATLTLAIDTGNRSLEVAPREFTVRRVLSLPTQRFTTLAVE